MAFTKWPSTVLVRKDRSPRDVFPSDWSRDGRYIIENTNDNDGRTGSDIWVLPLFGDRKPFAYLNREFNEGLADCRLTVAGSPILG